MGVACAEAHPPYQPAPPCTRPLSLACSPAVPFESFIKCFDEHLVIERLPQEGNIYALFVNERPSGFWPSLCSSNLRSTIGNSLILKFEIP